jgi:hypothetical protein
MEILFPVKTRRHNFYRTKACWWLPNFVLLYLLCMGSELTSDMLGVGVACLPSTFILPGVDPIDSTYFWSHQIQKPSFGFIFITLQSLRFSHPLTPSKQRLRQYQIHSSRDTISTQRIPIPQNGIRVTFSGSHKIRITGHHHCQRSETGKLKTGKRKTNKSTVKHPRQTKHSGQERQDQENQRGRYPCNEAIRARKSTNRS